MCKFSREKADWRREAFWRKFAGRGAEKRKKLWQFSTGNKEMQVARARVTRAEN
jgi:hypothetical protein